ncbi:MAG TPA: glycosyltransferase family 87 protein [Candidatus Binataceae bacterium]|nr:glycosyltransferase family 87 protein [Candidatus Binataceae bacterium]
MKFYSGVLLLAYLAAAIAQFFHAHHMIFASGANIGGDFINPYAASIAALKGDPAAVYDIHRQHLQEMAAMGGRDTGVLGFHYPPTYLLMVLPLSMLPFFASWVVFESVTLAGYLVVLRRIARIPLGLWLAITFPAVIINFMCGQNGFLTTALIGGGLLILGRWPLLAGLLFGLMTYKPQFAVLIPLALIAARRWRALTATAISAILFASVSSAVLGAPVWRAFFSSIAFTQKIVLEHGAIDFSSLQTIFGAIRMWGGGIGVSYVFQAAVAIYAASAVVWIWRTGCPFALKCAALAAGSLMVSPYVLQYDLVLLALPIAWLGIEGFEKGFLPYEKIVLLVAWAVPRIALPVSQIAGIPIGPIVIIALMTVIVRRASYRESAFDWSRPQFLAGSIDDQRAAR